MNCKEIRKLFWELSEDPLATQGLLCPRKSPLTKPTLSWRATPTCRVSAVEAQQEQEQPDAARHSDRSPGTGLHTQGPKSAWAAHNAGRLLA